MFAIIKNVDDWLVVDGESRIMNEFWVAPDGNVCRYHMASEDTYESVCAIVSLHRVIAERLFPDIPNADDYMHRMGYILVQLDSYYRWPSCVGSPTQAQINTMWDFGYDLDAGCGVGIYGTTYHFRKRVV